ncbi:hypothetical protein SH16_00188 [Aeromonas caviae]|nr:hypothetical protein SH16_00188 [Aeromonas caviae]
MKKTALTMAISSLLLAGGAQAANVYDQNGTKLDIGGRVNGMYYGTDDNATEGDASYLRLHIAGALLIKSVAGWPFPNPLIPLNSLAGEQAYQALSACSSPSRQPGFRPPGRCSSAGSALAR